jgi:hypothetical protein
MKMEKWELLKWLQEWGRKKKKLKENDGGGELNYDIV